MNTGYHHPHQLALFAGSIPEFLACSDDFGNVLRLPREQALKRAYVAPNPAAFINCLVFDVDRPEAGAAWMDSDMPPPNWVTQNKKNGHAHLGYVLEAPVSRTLKARATPQRYLARIQHAMTSALDADRAYAHFLTKTPEHPRWRTHWPARDRYSLGELRDWLPCDLPLRIARTEAVGEGRNVTLFDSLRFWAYRECLHHEAWETWLEACARRAGALNAFSSPLPTGEVASTAKSVAKWTWANITESGFSKVQQVRGKKSGACRAAAAMESLALALELNK